MVDTSKLDSWLDACKPDSSTGKGELIEALRTCGNFGQYQCKQDGDYIVLESFKRTVRLPKKDLDKLIKHIENEVEVIDEDDPDEGLQRALDRRSND